MRLSSLSVLFLTVPTVVVTTGCNLSHLSTPSQAVLALPAISGRVHGGQQPISGALIQLYASNTTILMGASTALIPTPVRSDANGGFSIPSTYTCPSPSALVYIVASGGNPGLPGNINNAAIAEMTVLGTCGSLTSYNYVAINELTTVVAVEALAPFMVDYTHVGASTVSSLATAFSNAIAYVDPSTGQFRANLAAGVTAPTALLDTLADILAACVNTFGGTVGNGTPCGRLFQYSTGTTGDIVAALLYIVNHSTANISELFALVVPNGPFLPVLTTAPTSFVEITSSPLTSSVSHSRDQLLADSQGHIWLLQVSAGYLTQYDSNLTVLHTYIVGAQYAGAIGYGGSPSHMALDASDNLWVPLYLSLLKIAPSGSFSLPASGYLPTNLGLFTLDSIGNVWLFFVRSNDNTVCANEYTINGSLISPSTGYCSAVVAGGIAGPTQATADSSGNVYLMTEGSGSAPILKFNSAGVITSLPTAINNSMVNGFFQAIFDPKYQHIWAHGNATSSLALDGSILWSNNNVSASPEPNGLAVDGAGNLWVANGLGTLTEVNPTGVLLSGCNVYSICGIPTPAYNTSLALAGIAIDPAGDVFTVDAAHGNVLKFTGIAAPR